jgi:ATP-dependent Lon protease
MQEWLPLFPLQVVLLPNGELPLHIFEERYREMIQEALIAKSEFGVVLANEKGILNTGCTARIDRVMREYPDGRMDILTKGHRRFEIVALNEDRVFLRGEVSYFDDEVPAEPAPVETIQQAIEGYNALRALESSTPLALSDAGNPQLSFKLAQPISDLSMRQALLVARSEADRIRQLAAYLPSYVNKQRRISHVKQVAPRNGHGGSASVIH